jgi:AcrR family transcriptional regulator
MAPNAATTDSTKAVFWAGSLICAAFRVFRERGYEGTAVADLQEALGGLSPPSLYAAFGSKEELFMEAVGLYTGQIRAAAERALAQAPTTKAKVEALLRRAVVATTEPGEPQGCLLVQGAIVCSPSSDNVQRYLHELRIETHRTITKCLKDGLAAGELLVRTDRENHAHAKNREDADGQERALPGGAEPPQHPGVDDGVVERHRGFEGDEHAHERERPGAAWSHAATRPAAVAASGHLEEGNGLTH